MSGRTLEKRSSKKRAPPYSKETFQMYDVWLSKFLLIHHIIYASIGDNLENFYKILDEKFFEWLNKDRNFSKFMFEIKREFMAIADEVLLFEIMFDSFKKQENYFIIPVFREKSESESDIDIDSYPEPDPPCYSLIEEKQVSQESISDIENPLYDDDYYLSFFS